MKLLIKEIVSKVFPTESLATWDTGKISLENKFLAIFGQEELRWIIPQNPQYGLPVLQQWRPYGALSYLKWMILLFLYRIGKLEKLPGVHSFGIIQAVNSNWQHLGKIRKKLIPTIYVGTPGSTRKAIAFLSDRDTNNLYGIAKVPLETKAANRILQEIDTLTCLAAEKPNLAPRKLFCDRDRGIAVQTPILGKPVTKGLSVAHLEWLSSLVIPKATTSISEQAVKLRERLKTLSNFNLGDYQLFDEVISSLNNSTPLPLTWVHGDFAPWNLKWIEPQKIAVLDWEEARPNGLPLQDLFHYFYIQSHLLQPNPHLLDCLFKMPIVVKYLQSLEIDRSCYEQLAKFYLADSWIRSIEKQDFSYATFVIKEITYFRENKI